MSTQPFDRFAWFATGWFFAWVALLLFVVFIVKDPTTEKVQRGWFEHQGKVYRVVPAEVR
ncbi:hypothetical protein [Methylopila sp. 73B]|uniref:hypothetical protein n=1 Tax=Methylopila sp. 73B TaxID=1120792 RepID=UPI000378F772|nr:hypothetical protein [Methylopila sp. 73B]